jgi:hypothetical protein
MIDSRYLGSVRNRLPRVEGWYLLITLIVWGLVWRLSVSISSFELSGCAMLLPDWTICGLELEAI